MISIVGTEKAAKIYCDTEGIDEMIHYLNYLKEKNETTYDLVVGNELDKLDEDMIPEGYENIVYLELVYLNAYDSLNESVKIINED